MKLSVIIPVFNEVNTVAEVIRRVMAVRLDLEREIIVVDDGSTDGTTEVLRQLQSALAPEEQGVLLCHFATRNQGKGYALRRGLAVAEGDIVLFQDADLELDPGEYPALLGPILTGETDVVFGRRSYWSVPDTRLSSRLANGLLAALTTLLYGQVILDMETAYKVMRRAAVRRLKLVSDGFEIEPELTAKLRLTGQRILEVPIHYEPRTVAEGKKMRWRDGFIAIWTLLKWRFAPPEQVVAAGDGGPRP